MNKDILKGKMNQTRLRNRFLRTRNIEDKKFYSKQWSYCVSLIRKTKQQYYNNLDDRSLPITHHFGNISNLFFPIEALTLA